MFGFIKKLFGFGSEPEILEAELLPDIPNDAINSVHEDGYPLIGYARRVNNIDKKPNAGKEYVHVLILNGENPDELFTEDLLLTDHEFSRAIDRASKNNEDLPF